MSHAKAIDAVSAYFAWVIGAVGGADTTLAVALTPKGDSRDSNVSESDLQMFRIMFYTTRLIPRLRELATIEPDRLRLVARPLIKLYAAAYRCAKWSEGRAVPLSEDQAHTASVLFVTPIAHYIMDLHAAMIAHGLIDGVANDTGYKLALTSASQQSPEVLYIDNLHLTAAEVFLPDVACHCCSQISLFCIWDKPGTACLACKPYNPLRNCSITVNGDKMRVTAFVGGVSAKRPDFRRVASASDVRTLRDVKAELDAAVAGCRNVIAGTLEAQDRFSKVYEETLEGMRIVDEGMRLLWALLSYEKPSSAAVAEWQELANATWPSEA
ncbi:hypothetical protein EXIGLDRAFT_701218 [Exidia glandulosa HHB12029]|uniref:Uncharacterized protein n=1 Tax=Exidia glandulosa HHB12029 TaxID=1314781 RepID=A0A165LWW3_EXIGL|nr:hypothetical protein EXIGLDRAFT_701218 [Exidia glandulosa HHB12029]